MKLDHGQVKGSAAEHFAAAAYLMRGFKVYHQDHESGGADMVLEQDGRFLKIQVKAFYKKTYGGKRNAHYLACLERSGYSKSRTAESRDMRADVDFFALVDLNSGEVFQISPSNKSCISKAEAEKRGVKIFPLE